MGQILLNSVQSLSKRAIHLPTRVMEKNKELTQKMSSKNHLKIT